ncbi:hypothetical protein TNIN_445321 [Trichonephila inaurata madagascariensis]|uniref:Uncharacterized protein n=1 Tax=Trichonephila inaurata madagascariensis TaxID=2747483 RepID=A0A8X6XAB6_9ARAC|nr:hypothetical protein TNIN_445321 [Trichonephila inaurata madagascariensis]
MFSGNVCSKNGSFKNGEFQFYRFLEVIFFDSLHLEKLALLQFQNGEKVSDLGSKSPLWDELSFFGGVAVIEMLERFVHCSRLIDCACVAVSISKSPDGNFLIDFTESSEPCTALEIRKGESLWKVSSYQLHEEQQIREKSRSKFESWWADHHVLGFGGASLAGVAPDCNPQCLGIAPPPAMRTHPCTTWSSKAGGYTPAD